METTASSSTSSKQRIVQATRILSYRATPPT